MERGRIGGRKEWREEGMKGRRNREKKERREEGTEGGENGGNVTAMVIFIAQDSPHFTLH